LCGFVRRLPAGNQQEALVAPFFGNCPGTNQVPMVYWVETSAQAKRSHVWDRPGNCPWNRSNAAWYPQRIGREQQNPLANVSNGPSFAVVQWQASGKETPSIA
jgi:hypothetical protein